MCLSVLFLNVPSAPIITGTVLVLSCYIFLISFLYLLILLYSLTDKSYNLLAQKYQLEGMFFFYSL